MPNELTDEDVKRFDAENAAGSEPLGRCEWVDVNGNERCNNFSKFQCEQAAGTWDRNEKCDGGSK